MIVVATITPDMGFPNTACFVQSQIGARKAFCFDIEAACSGFVYAPSWRASSWPPAPSTPRW
jgi:3-oxoacyl-[acyl-carrier-protein] synthase-3